MKPCGAVLGVVVLLAITEAYDDSQCSSRQGTCQMTSLSCDGGSYKAGLCGGPSGRRCCIGAYDDSQCASRQGTCQMTSSSCDGGSYEAGLCGGPSGRRCCIKTYDDSQCASRQGTCQLTSLSCDAGSYVAGLCGGPADRRCCVGGGAGGACSQTQKDLACELFASSNIRAAQRHPSGNTDNAYPYNNLRDMCDGKPASRSSYYCTGLNCYAPGGTVCLHTTLLQYLKTLKDNGPVIINELAGACHSCTSRHYRGLAVDMHNDARTSEYLDLCRAMGGWADDEGSHVHCQFYDDNE